MRAVHRLAVEGDRRERIALDKDPWTFDKVRKRVTKHFLWLMIAWWTGGAWVLYFADAPTLDVSDASGNEDSAIALDIDAGLTDSSEVLSITISGVPDGATLSAGTDNGDGTWTLSSDQLSGLTITPPEDFSGPFDLGVTATSADGEDVASATGSITVDVDGVADADARLQPLGRVDLHQVGRLLGQRLGQLRAAGEQRRAMHVRPHPEQQDRQRKLGRQTLVQILHRHATSRHHADELGGGGLVGQQPLAQQPLVRPVVIRRHPALVRQKDVNAVPMQVCSHHAGRGTRKSCP